LGKALNYDQAIKGKSPNILLVADSDDGVRELRAAFQKVGAAVRVANAASAESAADWADAMYVFPGQLTPAVRNACMTHKVLSLSATVGDVEAGNASVAVGVNNGKPQLVINLSRVQAEGHKLSSRLLKLARVVR